MHRVQAGDERLVGRLDQDRDQVDVADVRFESARGQRAVDVEPHEGSARRDHDRITDGLSDRWRVTSRPSSHAPPRRVSAEVALDRPFVAERRLVGILSGGAARTALV